MLAARPQRGPVIVNSVVAPADVGVLCRQIGEWLVEIAGKRTHGITTRTRASEPYSLLWNTTDRFAQLIIQMPNPSRQTTCRALRYSGFWGPITTQASAGMPTP